MNIRLFWKSLAALTITLVAATAASAQLRYKFTNKSTKDIWITVYNGTSRNVNLLHFCLKAGAEKAEGAPTADYYYTLAEIKSPGNECRGGNVSEVSRSLALRDVRFNNTSSGGVEMVDATNTPPAQSGNVKVVNHSDYALWMTFYGKPDRENKKAYGCVNGGTDRTFNNISGASNGVYWYLVETKERKTDCNGGNTTAQDLASDKSELRFKNDTRKGQVVQER